MKFIAMLNALNTPWLAIIVILMGMGYAVVSKIYGLSGDGASGVIGAGIGLLTGQALSKTAPPGIAQTTTTTTRTIPPPPAPQPSPTLPPAKEQA